MRPRKARYSPRSAPNGNAAASMPLWITGHVVEAFELAALEVRDRNQLRLRIAPEALQHLRAELDVVGVDDRRRDEARERQREVVAVAVHEVELVRLLEGPGRVQRLGHAPVPDLIVSR